MTRPMNMAVSFGGPGTVAVFGAVPRCLHSRYISKLKLAIYFLNAW
jgi:hypothetical protein